MPELFEHPEGTSLGEIEVDRVLTVPNVITTVRLLCVPLFLYLLFARDSRAWAAVLLGALGATDWVDGYIARRFNQTSTFGKMYDPTVDRFMLVVAIVAILIDGQVPYWHVGIILVREVVVSSWVVFITIKGAKRMNVTWWGKVGTFANMCVFPWFLFAREESWSEGWQTMWWVLAHCAAIPGVIFSVLAGWQYFQLGVWPSRRAAVERAAVAT